MIKLAFITQEDSVAIPENVEKVLQLSGVNAQLIAIVDSSGSVANRKWTFARGFGVRQTFRMGLALLRARVADAVDSVCGYRLAIRKRSVKAVARKNGVPFTVVKNANDDAFVEYVESLDLDLIVSFSCPSVFKTRLLRAARVGCINMHCSYLPRYAGLLPSFWVLHHGENETGATVHYMDDKIDNGAILNQCRVPIEPGMTMFQLIRKTKAAGGELMVRTIEQLMNGGVQTMPNPSGDGSYFSWPTVEQMREFRRRGGRLI
jgi:methionyl-tRNA formyltransferase